ncbi:MAG: VCBS repeat-containing protein [Thermoanaerobaculia bacterium]|nr:VCBS repeat-containing protein [Thermoanaerobaculia bacterium]
MSLRRLCLSLLVFVPLFAVGPPAYAERLEFRHLSLDLPAAPAVLLPVDLDGDGRRDLVTALVYTEWDQISIEESTEMDGVEGLVEVLTIVPSLAERRELRVWLADPSAPSGYRPAGQWMELDRSVVGLEAGPPGIPVLALTDEGLATLVLDDEGLRFEALVADPPVHAGTGTLIPNLGIVQDVSGDGIDDVMLPARDGLAIYLGTGDGIAPEAAFRRGMPSDEFDTLRGRRVRRYPLPQVRDVTGDGLPDLLIPDRTTGWRDFHVVINRGHGVFDLPIEVEAPESCREEKDAEGTKSEPALCLMGQPRHFGDLDGDGLAEWMVREDLSDPDAGLRKEIKEAKNPPGVFRLYRSRNASLGDFAPESEHYAEFRAVGYSIEIQSDQSDGDDGFRLPGGLADLDGDGDQDLIAVTLDFSAFQLLRVMTTKTFGMGVDLHLFCLGEDGYKPVAGLDLSGKFRIHLDDIRMSHLSVFEGDFDADGRRDFVQLGRGKNVTIHGGREGCRYPTEPDWTIRLEKEPANLALVRIEDFDGDERSDLGVLQPLPRPEDGASRAVRLELYLSSERSTEASR